ncbi:MAG TPA: endonuclease/exonuclease/phosphatase family protein [Candidatus Limnocylindrales bacterium]|nr:endonuclease/exonuclease/phosphatase family protein [Candidatus Limnocylindrales bacterium]
MRAITRLAVAYACVALAVLVIGAVLPVDDGALGMLAILAPYFALAVLPLVPLAVVSRSRVLGLAVAAVAAVFMLRLGGEWWSFPPAPVADGLRTIDVATWNIEAGAAPAPTVVAMLNRHPVDIVVLEELTFRAAEAIEADPAIAARYPHQALFPTRGVTGVGILSAFPLSDTSSAMSPARFEATIDVDGRRVIVLGAHPFPAEISLLAGTPVGLKPATRNADLALVRKRVLELDVQGNDVLLVGDFNTAPTEPAFERLTAGLHDAHAEVGVGPGWTWRPAPLEFLGTGLLRIDLILSTSALLPQRTSIECPARGDHCLFEATIALTR